MDLVADVLQQANAKKLKLATLKLTGAGGKTATKGASAEFEGATGALKPKFAQNVAKLEHTKDQSRVPGYASNDTELSPPTRETQKAAAMRGLETVLATKMVEAMMPKDQDELYGEGTAGEIWRGFHIETMGKALASQRLFSTSVQETAGSSADTGTLRRTKMIAPYAG
jgi:hypothetical protein